MKFFDIHVKYGKTGNNHGYSIFVKANVENSEEAVQYAIDNHLFTEDGDECCIDNITEIDEKEYDNSQKI